MSFVLYTYGTLRPGDTEVIPVRGTLYDLGWFPGIKVGGDRFVMCERVIVDDITATDQYEGYDPRYPDESLYIRREFLDGYIYEFNRDINPNKVILSGDWLDYTQEKRGRNGGRFSRSAR
jgi:gamma-glutamylcyclotransferase (GGCT)/AIG2-like uncharacterized protein YtfP